MRRPHSSLSPALIKALCVLALASITFGCARRPSSPEPALNSISGDRMLADIRTLSSDQFEGRGPGSKGEELTIRYLQDQFHGAGLEPGNPGGTYLQSVRLVGITADPQMKLTFTWVVGLPARDLVPPSSTWDPTSAGYPSYDGTGLKFDGGTPPTPNLRMRR